MPWSHYGPICLTIKSALPLTSSVLRVLVTGPYFVMMTHLVPAVHSCVGIPTPSVGMGATIYTVPSPRPVPYVHCPCNLPQLLLLSTTRMNVKILKSLKSNNRHTGPISIFVQQSHYREGVHGCRPGSSPQVMRTDIRITENFPPDPSPMQKVSFKRCATAWDQTTHLE